MKYSSILILAMTLVCLFGCQGKGQTVKSVKKSDEKNTAFGDQLETKPGVKIGGKFILKMNESAKLEDANIKIIVNRIGRKWLANGGGESLDFVFSVERDGKVESYSPPLPDLITVGDYKIEVVKTEPFGNGYAIFLVTKNDSVRKEELCDGNTGQINL